MKNLSLIACSVALTFALAACGDGGDLCEQGADGAAVCANWTSDDGSVSIDSGSLPECDGEYDELESCSLECFADVSNEDQCEAAAGCVLTCFFG